MSRENLEKSSPQRITKRESKGKMKNLLLFLPRMFTLLGKLIKDSRVPLTEKALFAAAIVYVIMPLDFIPDFIPFVGQIDDVYLVALTLLRLINRTDESIIREHWTGSGDIVSIANSVVKFAPMLLPKRISKVLSAKVELAPNGQNIRKSIKNNEAFFVEIPPVDDK